MLGHQTVLCFSCLLCLPSSLQEGEQRGQREEASGFGAWPGLTTGNESWAGHDMALRDLLEPSCRRIELIYKAATQSRTERSLAGGTGRERSFTHKKKARGRLPGQNAQRFRSQSCRPQPRWWKEQPSRGARVA